MRPLDSATDGLRRRLRRQRSVRPAVDQLESRTLPATFVVNATFDEPDANPGDGLALTVGGQTTLRAAVMESNALGGADTIVLPAGTYRLTRLSQSIEDFDSKGDLDVFESLTLTGAGSGGTIIDGQFRQRLFDLHDSGAVTLRDVTLTGGQSDLGGAIRVQGSSSLKASSTVVRNNRAEFGGAIAALGDGGSVVLADSFFQANTAAAGGGAIYAVGRSLSISGSTFAGNSAYDGGAATAVGGQWTIGNSTFSGNRAPKRGGAIESIQHAFVSMANCTIAGNASSRGGGIVADGELRLTNTAIAGNSAADGPDVRGEVSSFGFNLIGNNAGSQGFGQPGDIVGTAANPIDALLAPIALYGGMTPTRLPLPGSPLLNAGRATAPTDQRGVPRPVVGADIGAVEARSFTLARLTTQLSAQVGTLFAPLRVQFREGDRGIAGVSVTFTAPTSGPSGTFAGPTTALTDANGVAAAPPFSANTVPGGYAVRAAIAGGVFLDLPLTNLSGAGAQVSVQTSSAARAGDVVPVTITVRDVFGNIARNFEGPLTLSSTDSRASVPAVVTFTAADRGVKTASIVWRTAGTQQLTVTKGALSVHAATMVDPAAAARLVLTAPAAARAGDRVPITIAARDEFGNVATDFTGAAILTSSDAQADLPTGVAFTPANRGIKSVDITLRTAGSNSLTVQAGGLSATIAIGIAAAAASRIDVAAPANARAGEIIPLTLTIRDAFGNVATEFVGPLTLNCSDSQATLPANGAFTPADRGVKTISATLGTAGNQTIALSAGPLSAAAAIAVRAAVASRLDIASPDHTRAGETVPLTLTVRDAFGNVVTDFVGPLTITCDDPDATLPGDIAMSAADAGVKSFGAALRTAGDKSLTVSAGSLNVSHEVAVSPAALDHFAVGDLAPVDEGAPFAVTLTALDAFGNVATNFAGTIGLTSDDPNAQLPPALAMTTADGGIRTVDGLVLRSPGVRALHFVDRGSGVAADAEITVGNLGPRDLSFSTGASEVDEGDSITVNGSFANIDRADTHTVAIRWGDGTRDTILTLGPGVTTFRATHVYGDDSGASPATIHVTVEDADGGTATAQSPLQVRNVGPQWTVIPPAGAAIGHVGEAFAMSVTFTDPGEDSWIAAVDYGDGFGSQIVHVGADRGFQLHHVYTSEGTFTVVVNLTDDDGGVATYRERIAVLLPGTGAVKMIVVGPGETGTLRTDTYGVEFVNSSPTTPAVFLAALVDRGTIERVAGNPTDDPQAKVIAVDFRALDADSGSKLSIVLNYEPTGVPPELRFIDPATGVYHMVRGSARYAESFRIDRENHAVHVILDGSTSSPRLGELSGTLFTLTVPAPPPTKPPEATQSPSPQRGFFVPPNALVSGDPGAVLRGAIPTTPLTVGGDVTITLASSDGLRRGGSDSDAVSTGPRLPPVVQFLHDLFEIRQVIYEAFRMWLEHPAPLQAPPVIPPPPVDELESWQIRLDGPSPELRENEPAWLMTVPAETRADATVNEPPSLALDAAAAIASRKPWWLADAAPAAPTPSAAQDPIAVPQVTSEPTSDQQAMAALAGIWIGGHALALAAPDVPDEEPKFDPRRTRLKLRVKPEEK